jgi:RimJ/RimL family protein N-acetyltransferase
MELELPGCRIRSWRAEDAASIAKHADNRNIWLNVRDRFPHPYTVAHAEAWLAMVLSAEPVTQFAIEVDGEAAGGVGLFLQEDVSRYTAEIGYWLGEAFWGRGVMTDVVRRFTDYAFATWDLNRIYANVFAWNEASVRVLEKAGYQFEGRQRSATVKDGRVVDNLMYAVVREFRPGGGPVRPD